MDLTIWKYIMAGFFAQMIDGALGMAYGVSCTTLLLSTGVSPVAASASVHLSEVFTTMVSGFSHFKLRNIDKNLLKKLVVPGVIGGIIGAYLLSNISGEAIKPFVSGYLLIMGGVIIFKAFKKSSTNWLEGKKIFGLGLVGGFFDAIGGGGWGPIVTSTLVASGHNPRIVIGTVNTAEFFVTVAQAATFVTLIGLMQNLQVIIGLAIGGVIAAPIAAVTCKKLPAKTIMILVGVIIIILNLRTFGIKFF